MTPEAGGIGLNLQQASLLVKFYGGLWNPAMDYQVERRIVRFGSPFETVRVVRIYCAFTIQSWMMSVSNRKNQEAQKVLGGAHSNAVYGGDDSFNFKDENHRATFKDVTTGLAANMDVMSKKRADQRVKKAEKKAEKKAASTLNPIPK